MRSLRASSRAPFSTSQVRWEMQSVGLLLGRLNRNGNGALGSREEEGRQISHPGGQRRLS